MTNPLHRGLYAITDPELLDADCLIPSVEQALLGGCRVVQYRDKPATEIERLQRARSLQSLCQQYGAQLIINDDPDLCRRSQAHGVHLGKSDGNIIEARRMLGPDRILGVTCHSDLVYAQRCIEAGVDYCAFGRMFPSLTKPKAPACPPEVIPAALKLAVPIVAIGGINLDNMPSLMHTSIQHVAVIHGLFGQKDIQTRAQQFQHFFSHAE